MVMFLAEGGLIPSLDTFLGWLDLITRFLVLAGPLSMLGWGLYFFLAPPKEANYSVGYRFRYGMSKVPVWLWMQRLAGMVYGGLGLVLTIVMGLVCIRFSKVQAPEMVKTAVICLIIEAILVAAATLAINIAVMLRYDRKGNLRKK